MSDAGALTGRTTGSAQRKPAKTSVIISGEEVKNYAQQQVNCCAGHFVCSTLGVLLVVANNEVDHMSKVADACSLSYIFAPGAPGALYDVCTIAALSATSAGAAG